MIELAVELDAERLEVAQVQYYGWALRIKLHSYQQENNWIKQQL